MGHIEETFSEMTVAPHNEMNGQMFTVEKAENFHIHWRNYRLVFNKEEFVTFMERLKYAYESWIKVGKPDADPNHPVDTPPVYYLRSVIEPVRHEPQKNGEMNKILVELQKYAEWARRDDFMHVHYKDLRIDLTVSEFAQFASVMEDGKQHMLQYLRRKKGETGKEVRMLSLATEVFREDRRQAMIFTAEVDINMLTINWNSMYTQEQMLQRPKCQEVRASLLADGLQRPLRYAFVLGNKTAWGALLDGHHRVVAAKDIGWSRIMVQFEIWIEPEHVPDIETLRGYMEQIFQDKKMVDDAFAKNKIKLDSMEDLIW